MVLTVLVALTIQHLLAAPLFTSTFFFHSDVSATQDRLLARDEIATRGAR